MALNDTVGDEANLDNTPLSNEQATEEVSVPEAEVATEAEGTQTETESESSKGAAARIRELNSKAKAAEERAQSLEERLAELTGSVEPQGYTPQFNPQESIVAPGEEIDAREFETRVLARANAQAEIRIKQSESINRINNEANEVLRKYPELDPQSDSFNRELSDAVTEATEAYVRANPYTASVKKFAEKLMKPYQGAVAKEVGQASENIAKQVSQAAIRPTSVRKTEKSADEKSVEELERDLGIVQF